MEQKKRCSQEINGSGYKPELTKAINVAIYIIYLVLVGLFFPEDSASALTCVVRAGCNASETALLRMQATDNSHAGFVGSSAYDNLICCLEAGVTVGTNCSGNYDTFLKLSAADNAHVEKKSFFNYASNACISVDAGSISCSYSAGACPIGFACLAKISADTNAHIGSCIASAYANSICCGYNAAAICDNDGTCDTGENNANCPADCPAACVAIGGACPGGNSDCCSNNCVGGVCAAAAICDNDGTCDTGENNANCPADCKCGDGIINGSEVCDINGDIGCAAPTPSCNTDCSGCIGCSIKSKFSFLGKPVICIVQDAIKWILSVIGSIVLLILIISGIYYMFSGDNPKKQESAKKMIAYAIIGIILIFVSYALLALLDKIFVQP